MLFDLFRPRYKHSNPEIRLHEVRNILSETDRSDIEKLVWVAINDNNADVRNSAVEKIASYHYLAQIVNSGTDDETRYMAVKKIYREEVIRDIALFEKNGKIKAVALSKIDDVSVLSQFIYNDDQVIKNAANARLSEIVSQKGHKWEDRCRAVELIYDIDVLYRFALVTMDYGLAIAGMQKISDESLLANIILKARSIDVQRAAIDKIKDQQLLLEISNNDECGRIVRKYICKKLGIPLSQKELVDIVTKERDILEQRAAFFHVTDQSILTDFANGRIDMYESDIIEFRISAIEKLEDISTLMDLQKNDKIQAIREAASKRLSIVNP